MKLKTLILILLLAAAGLLFYDYAVTQYSPDAMAYKRFSTAVLEGDAARVRNMIADESVMDAMAAAAYRQELIDGEPRFVYYTFLRRMPSADGNRVELSVRQSIRVDPYGSGNETIFGSETRRDQHRVTLVRDGPSWKIMSFEDSSTQRWRMDREQGRR